MRTYPCTSMRDALETAFYQAMRTGMEHQIGDCGDPYGWRGYAVIQHEGSTYPGIAAPSSWCWVASVRPDGSCDHHRGHLSRWDAEIKRARNAVRNLRAA